MNLSKEVLPRIDQQKVSIPTQEMLNLPEKVLQFGTGVLLRGLPDYFIDQANRRGIFNGRVVIVKSTGTATAEFDQQDSLYTIGIRGLTTGQNIEENIISAAVSRVLSAERDWQQILDLAGNKLLKVIVSNTTEVGIQLVEEAIYPAVPSSFPAKLLAFLYQRYRLLQADLTSGLVIIATELIPANGKKLEEIVYQLARHNQLEEEFITWSMANNIFCNSLVDRIVPGKPDQELLEALEKELGYEDQLLILAEPYRLWAIEGDERVANVLSFSKADNGVIVAADIEIYRELKLRLLNGTHTLTAGIACLSGIETVKNGMDNSDINQYVKQVMQKEIAQAIPYPVSMQEALAFSATVIDRFANPHIKHLWLSITMQYTMKLKIRILPVLMQYYQTFNHTPPFITFGFAAYLHFMRIHRSLEGKYYGLYNGIEYLVTDDSAAYFQAKTKQETEADYPAAVLNDGAFWGSDLQILPGFIIQVQQYYQEILLKGITVSLQELTQSLPTERDVIT